MSPGISPADRSVVKAELAKLDALVAARKTGGMYDSLAKLLQSHEQLLGVRASYLPADGRAVHIWAAQPTNCGRVQTFVDRMLTAGIGTKLPGPIEVFAGEAAVRDRIPTRSTEWTIGPGRGAADAKRPPPSTSFKRPWHQRSGVYFSSSLEPGMRYARQEGESLAKQHRLAQHLRKAFLPAICSELNVGFTVAQKRFADRPVWLLALYDHTGRPPIGWEYLDAYLEMRFRETLNGEPFWKEVQTLDQTISNLAMAFVPIPSHDLFTGEELSAYWSVNKNVDGVRALVGAYLDACEHEIELFDKVRTAVELRIRASSIALACCAKASDQKCVWPPLLWDSIGAHGQAVSTTPKSPDEELCRSRVLVGSSSHLVQGFLALGRVLNQWDDRSTLQRAELIAKGDQSLWLYLRVVVGNRADPADHASELASEINGFASRTEKPKNNLRSALWMVQRAGVTGFSAQADGDILDVEIELEMERMR